ncbi:MAG: hypothetical protein QXY40_05005 [Candidatus Methanomethylicia archaeon]
MSSILGVSAVKSSSDSEYASSVFFTDAMINVKAIDKPITLVRKHIQNKS